MSVKAYISGVYTPVPPEWQEAVLAPVVPGWPNDVSIFRDHVSRLDRRRKNPAILVDRAEMLRPTTRREPDTIYLASLTVLGFDENDVEEAAKSILERGGTIIAVSEGLTIAGAAEVDDLMMNWKAARKRQRVTTAQKVGGRNSAEIRKTKAAEGVARIKPYWGMPADEWPTEKLRRMAGTETEPMAYNTIVAHIGYGRYVARKRYMAALRRKKKITAEELV